MPPKHHYQTIKRRKKSPAGIIAVIAVITLIVTGGTVFGLFMVSNAVGDVISKAEVTLTCAVSGNDLVVEVLEGGRANEITTIELVMEGYTLPPGFSVKTVPDSGYPKKIKYENMVAGIYGDLQVSFKATFNNGDVKTVWMDTVRFS